MDTKFKPGSQKEAMLALFFGFWLSIIKFLHTKNMIGSLHSPSLVSSR